MCHYYDSLKTDPLILSQGKGGSFRIRGAAIKGYFCWRSWAVSQRGQPMKSGAAIIQLWIMSNGWWLQLQLGNKLWPFDCFRVHTKKMYGGINLGRAHLVDVFTAGRLDNHIHNGNESDWTPADHTPQCNLSRQLHTKIPHSRYTLTLGLHNIQGQTLQTDINSNII